MPAQGPNSCVTVVNDTSIGTSAWTTITNVTASDNTYARQSVVGTTDTNYIKCTDFGFSIPAESVINGITVEVECRYFSSGSATVEDNSIRLVKGGTITGSNLSVGALWPASDTYRSFGNASELWGESWTSTDINSSTFGVVVGATLTDAGLSGAIAFVDHIRITVNYSLASSASLLMVSD